MARKERLDIVVTERGLFKSRSRAKRAIMAGLVFVNGQREDKAGTQIDPDAKIEFRGDKNPYVSRGGFKLEKALKVFDIDPDAKEAIDIGASTGGFTDCLLQHEAQKVYAIDVGYGQLAWKLRQDERVKVFERCNFRYLEKDELPVKVPLIVTDVSFISLRLIVPGVKKFIEQDGDFVALIKPQFEAGRERVGKNGVVKDPAVHKDVIKSLSDFFLEEGFKPLDLDYSPITGAASKNIEYLIHLSFTELTAEFDRQSWQQKIDKLVYTAHSELGGS
ncbi:23S rRNA (cytidine1920-2'-O)/16S rRNA (cytidine1409-2'-O)-methyltransferase [Halanaerobium saccharolyticum]|uniref:23S rRNA (Cytidine1920-2'-O)/16S rRNA (Cytidine1409-2'-O)-methyltransferase n=1 Tax=Halanaerobium saccharolyticum TaxID=43595 RepID=A0A4R7Z7C5_9FIRM|nr:TlyA family RNA methyltransferase [Halanaerobium saccharolyticum]RAK11065.1 23S rRNA (cytidine1920-2'-O)/16S rRNA (cytidine1409-2'-O)-methyltransferase [Halanaerobium saccharolyticum]TDW06916.1 23S rRNA (cytidine1920-2'-O)/16S rRNA (cytidine1409-2'-O)-methyltransferase [Halanaerobium saccharolyticum]TDX63681.1 23S rRNA (cytidine1920-2'-O)/16S rRNA (cytidine1409-2'-O)-methyltransferase [Halanaerobium saccharolyticum]